MISGFKSQKFHYQKLCRQQPKKAAQMLSWDLFAYTTERFVSLILLRITIHISICNHPLSQSQHFKGKLKRVQLTAGPLMTYACITTQLHCTHRERGYTV